VSWYYEMSDGEFFKKCCVRSGMVVKFHMVPSGVNILKSMVYDCLSPLVSIVSYTCSRFHRKRILSF
jgi:hypothetical protein